MAERQPSKLHVAGSNPVSRSIPTFDRTVAGRRAAIAEQSLRLRRALTVTIRPGPSLTTEARALSTAYRSGRPPTDPSGHVHDAASAAAYAAARMPATFSAIARALAATAERLPGFRPTSLLDVGAGTGAGAWAASAIWPSVAELSLLDREPTAIDLGRRLATASGGAVPAAANWRVGRLEIGPPATPADVVTAAYVLGEIPPGNVAAVIERLWAATRDILVLVEPGSPDGFERIRAARTDLIAAGGHVVAPCPGDAPCPLTGRAWCHFLARLDRSPLQRGAKGATRSWEDEPFSYVAIGRASATRAATPAARVVLGRPRQRPGMVELRICVDGRIDVRTLSRRDGPAWRTARDLEWGDPVPAEVLRAGR